MAHPDPIDDFRFVVAMAQEHGDPRARRFAEVAAAWLDKAMAGDVDALTLDEHLGLGPARFRAKREARRAALVRAIAEDLCPGATRSGQARAISIALDRFEATKWPRLRGCADAQARLGNCVDRLFFELLRLGLGCSERTLLAILVAKPIT